MVLNGLHSAWSLDRFDSMTGSLLGEPADAGHLGGRPIEMLMVNTAVQGGPTIPASSTWGLLTLMLTLVTVGTLMYGRKVVY